MEIDLDTFLVTVYCLVDDLYREHFAARKPCRPGRRPRLSDGEVLTLALLAQWQAQRSERAFLRYAGAHWRAYFPALLSQSAFNRRARDVGGVLCRLGPLVAGRLAAEAAPGRASAYRVLDGVPVPLMRRRRGRRGRLFGPEADVGRGGADDDWYYGVQLLLDVTATGEIAGFVLAPASADDRWLAEALFRWRLAPDAPPPTDAELAPILGKTKDRGGARRGPGGPIAPRQAVGAYADGPYLADLGFAGERWQRHWARDLGALVLTRRDFQAAPDAGDPRAAERAHARRRQVVERVNGWLTGALGLWFPRARTHWGLLTRVAAKVAAFNVVRCLNALWHRLPFAALSPFEATAA